MLQVFAITCNYPQIDIYTYTSLKLKKKHHIKKKIKTLLKTENITLAFKSLNFSLRETGFNSQHEDNESQYL